MCINSRFVTAVYGHQGTRGRGVGLMRSASRAPAGRRAGLLADGLFVLRFCKQSAENQYDRYSQPEGRKKIQKKDQQRSAEAKYLRHSIHLLRHW